MKDFAPPRNNNTRKNKFIRVNNNTNYSKRNLINLGIGSVLLVLTGLGTYSLSKSADFEDLFSFNQNGIVQNKQQETSKNQINDSQVEPVVKKTLSLEETMDKTYLPIVSSYEKYLGENGLDFEHIEHAQNVYSEYKDVIDKTANRNSVPIPVVLATIAQEYGIKNSPTGRRGFMQMYSDSGFDAIMFAKDDLEGTLWRDYEHFKSLAKDEYEILKIKGAFEKEEGKKYKKGELVSEWDQKYSVAFGFRVPKDWEVPKSEILTVLDIPEKNLEAGIVYLSEINETLSDWSLSIAAYHMGQSKFEDFVLKYLDSFYGINHNKKPFSNMSKDQFISKNVETLNVDLGKLLGNPVVLDFYENKKNKWDRLDFYGPRVLTMAKMFESNYRNTGDYFKETFDLAQN